MISNNDDVSSVSSTDPEATKNAKNRKGTSTPRADTRKESEQKRRVMETQYFDEVITLLTMSGEKTFSKKIDKASTLIEIVRYLRLYDDLADGSRQREGNLKELMCLQNGEVAHLLFDAMDAFLMIVSDSGRIFYCTELVTSLLGYMQARLVGQNIFDYILEQEVPLLKDLFVPQSGCPCVDDSPSSPIVCYPSREFQCNLKMYNGETGLFPQHLLFQCLSYLRVWKRKNTSPDLPCSPDECDMPIPRDSNIQSCILLIAKLSTSPSVTDLPISTNEVNFQFEIRISCEGKIVDIEKHATLVLGYLPGELVGSSFFDCIDPYQLTHLAESIIVIFSKGLGTTTPYRIRSKSGRHIWVISKGYLSYNPWNHKPDHVLLSTRVLGCDQVLSDHKFYRDCKLFPDLLHLEEWYDPGPLHQSKTSFSSCDANSGFTTSNLVPPHWPHPSPSHQPHPLPQGEASLYTAGTNVSDEVVMNENVKAIRRELHQKNQELFDLQCRFLEQQQLMEKERNQFYQITRQVMQCVTYPQRASPNMQIADAGGNIQVPLDMMSFEPSTKTNAMQGYNQEFNYMVGPGASSGGQFMESAQMNLPEAILSCFQQNNQSLLTFPTPDAILELPSPSMQMPLQTSQNNSYLGSASRHNNLYPPHTLNGANSSYTSMPYLPPSASVPYNPLPPSQQ